MATNKCEKFYSIVFTKNGRTYTRSGNYPKKTIALKDLRGIKKELKQVGEFSFNQGKYIKEKTPYPRLRVISHCGKR